MQKIPVDFYSNENFISPFFRPPGAANPKEEKTHPEPEYARMQNLAWIGPRVVEKSLSKKAKKQKHSKTNTSPFALTSEWRVTNKQTNSTWINLANYMILYD